MSSQLHHAVRDGITRTLAIVGLAGVALIHLLDAPGKFTETPYLGWMYVALIAGCLVVAGALVRTSDRRAWAAAAALPAGAIIGYVLTRTTGLPQATDDIGNWGEPLGIASPAGGAPSRSRRPASACGRRTVAQARATIWMHGPVGFGEYSVTVTARRLSRTRA